MDYKYSIRHQDDKLDEWVLQEAQKEDRSITKFIVTILRKEKKERERLLKDKK